jgi:hypothetical protein
MTSLRFDTCMTAKAPLVGPKAIAMHTRSELAT